MQTETTYPNAGDRDIDGANRAPASIDEPDATAATGPSAFSQSVPPPAPTSASGPRGHGPGRTWLERWEPEDEAFWRNTGKAVAWRTLAITTGALMLSFATWFMMSAVVVRLPGIGFQFDTMQLFWLAAMPGLAGGTLRILHMFLVPVYGTRHVITISTFIKLLPAAGIGLAVMNPGTPWWLFMALAVAAGFGGGDFSSHMPSTSLFFRKKLQGTALGIQAGIGNFGVSLAQFLTPWIIGFGVFGAVTGGPQVLVKAGKSSTIWLQNAGFIYVPFLLIVTVLAWKYLRSVPIRASFRDQFDIFRNKHTWACTATYVMTFGTFSGLSAAFPLMIKTIYGSFPDAPDPLTYAFFGPLIGSTMRVVCGPLADKYGGAILTHLTGIGLTVCTLALALSGALTPESTGQFPLFVGLMLALFFFTGIGNASTFRQYPIIFSHSPRQGAGVLGWTAAVAAYGPFIFSSLIGAVISSTGSAAPFFAGIAVYFVIATAINWWYYTRSGCEKPC